MSINKLGLLLTLALLAGLAGESPVAAPPLAVTAPDVADAPSGEAPPPPVEVPYIEQECPFDPQNYVHKLVVNEDNRASCVSLGGGLYVTAKHVFHATKFSLKVNATPVTVSGRVNLHPTEDVAVFRCDLDLPGCPFSIEPVEVGAEGVCCGYGSAFISHPCKVTGDETMDAGLHGIRGGDSGGGLFVDGTLVGIVVAYRDGDETKAVYESLSNVAGLLAPFSRGAEATTPAPGADDQRPVVTVYSPATWTCGPCDAMHGYDFSGLPFDVVFEKSDEHSVYPYAEWKKGNMTYWRTGVMTPAQLLSSWKQTH